jgi:hypothetical protein
MRTTRSGWSSTTQRYAWCTSNLSPRPVSRSEHLRSAAAPSPLLADATRHALVADFFSAPCSLLLQAKRAKSRKGRRVLGEEWMEHLMDRMEKEYTAELQVRQQGAAPRRQRGREGGSRADMPTVCEVQHMPAPADALLVAPPPLCRAPPAQKHPGKWLMQTGDPSGSDQPPAITIPSIQEMFPLEACLQVCGCGWVPGGPGDSRGIDRRRSD